MEIQLSPRPKSEVAHGLVCDKFPLAEDAEDFARPMAGERFKIGGQERDWKESPAAVDIQALRVRADRSFPVFSQFLKAIDRSVDEDTLDKVGGAVDTRFTVRAQEIADAIRRDPKTKADDLIRNEPVFIMALKRYLEMETDAWARQF